MRHADGWLNVNISYNDISLLSLLTMNTYFKAFEIYNGTVFWKKCLDDSHFIQYHSSFL